MTTSAGVCLPYATLGLDRGGPHRGDSAWVAGLLADPAARVVPWWRDRCLVAGAPAVPVTLARAEADAVLDAAPAPVLLGLDGEAGVFAAALSELDEADARARARADGVADLRGVVSGLDPAHASLLAYAKGMLHWHAVTRFCGACGARTEARQAGHVLRCPGCARLHFPRLEPAVIALVESPGPPRRCLLARHRGQPEGRWSTLAGFVEIGESLEAAVRRELHEEAGVRVGDVRYVASQPWPFPSGLMVGFRVVADDEDVRVDGEELVEARWFTADEVRDLRDAARRDGWARPDSIEDHLVGAWLDERG